MNILHEAIQSNESFTVSPFGKNGLDSVCFLKELTLPELCLGVVLKGSGCGWDQTWHHYVV